MLFYGVFHTNEEMFTICLQQTTELLLCRLSQQVAWVGGRRRRRRRGGGKEGNLRCRHGEGRIFTNPLVLIRGRIPHPHQSTDTNRCSCCDVVSTCNTTHNPCERQCVQKKKTYGRVGGVGGKEGRKEEHSRGLARGQAREHDQKNEDTLANRQNNKPRAPTQAARYKSTTTFSTEDPATCISCFIGEVVGATVRVGNAV
jgi:hypothetical protein